MRRGICAGSIRGRDADAPRLVHRLASRYRAAMRARSTAFSEWFWRWRCWKRSTASGCRSRIEVLGFSEEEGVRFGTPFIGSRALVGRLDEELLSREGRERNFACGRRSRISA